jgi:hypothetical protein
MKRPMLAFLTQLLHVIRSWFMRRARPEAENLLLRQRLAVLRRKSPKRVRLWKIDRLLLVWLYRLYPSLLNGIIIVQPETVIRWRQRGLRAYRRWKSRHVGGRPQIDSGIQAPRIHGELLMLGIEVAESTVGMLRDRDGAFGPAYTHSIRAMGILDHPTAPRSPWQNGHVERLIGSIRRECLDHLMVSDEAQLRRVLRNYATYYNQVRTHLSLDKNALDPRHTQKLGCIASIAILGGLHHQYVRV